MQNDYYGGSDASFSLEALHSWASSLPTDAQLAAFATVGDAVQELPTELSRLARRFSVDINPRFVLSKGSMVDLLISSETTHYLEFKTSEGLFHVHGAPKAGALASTRVQQVPASKADVFQHSMGPLDKRRLMKFIQVCCDAVIASCGDYNRLRVSPTVCMRGADSTKLPKLGCVQARKGLALPHATQIALAGLRRLRSTLTAAPALFTLALVTVAKHGVPLRCG